MTQNSIPSMPGKAKPYVMAHRGNSLKCPENTLAAFRQAIEDGADIIETDLHITADNIIVCIHDDTIDRTTNGSGEVQEMTLAELKTYSANNGKSGFEEETIPTLAELIEILPENVALAVEIKTKRLIEPPFRKQLVDQITAAKLSERTIVLSFEMPHLEAFREESDALHLGWITMSKSKPVRGPQILGPAWPLLLVNPFYVKTAHKNGQAVCPLDTAPDSRLWFYRKLGCDAILTDDPAATIAALAKLKKQK